MSKARSSSRDRSEPLATATATATATASAGEGVNPKPEAPTPEAKRAALKEKVLREARTARDLLFPTALTDVLDNPTVGPLGVECYVRSYVRDAGDPADPVEVILLQQLLMAHHRVSQLHLRAERAESSEVLKVLNGAAARLLGEVRRLALAIRQYRAPVGPKAFTVVRQQNVATEQQVTFVERPDGPLAKQHSQAHGELEGNDPAKQGDHTKGASNGTRRFDFGDDGGEAQESPAGRGRAAQRPQAAAVDG